MPVDGTNSTATRPLYGEYVTGDLVVAIEGGRIVTPDRTIESGTVLLQGKEIAAVEGHEVSMADRIIDASDKVVMPGVVDIHGDDFEQQFMPRSGAYIDARTALSATDRLNVSHGITTKLHAIAFEEAEAKQRSLTGSRDLVHDLATHNSLIGSNLVHARFELSCVPESFAADILADDLVALGSVMHHAPGEGQYEDPSAFHDRYRSGSGEGKATALAESRAGADRATCLERARTIADAAKSEGVPIASHDDGSPEAVKRAAAHGIEICEFPLSLETAAMANELGMRTVMGAPNLVRGESLFDNLTTERAIDRGVVDILCADYHPPSLLQSVFVETGEPLHQRVNRITKEPADLIGLENRGRIEPGARADLVVVDPEPVPTATDVITGGRLSFSNDPERE